MPSEATVGQTGVQKHSSFRATEKAILFVGSRIEITCWLSAYLCSRPLSVPIQEGESDRALLDSAPLPQSGSKPA